MIETSAKFLPISYAQNKGHLKILAYSPKAVKAIEDIFCLFDI